MHFPRYEDQDTQLLFSKWQNQKTTSVPFLIEKIWSKLYVLRNFDWEMLRCSKKPRLKHKLPITLSFSYCCKKENKGTDFWFYTEYRVLAITLWVTDNRKISEVIADYMYVSSVCYA